MSYHNTPVLEFHDAFNHPISYDPSITPSIYQRILRVQMLASELVELSKAMGVRLYINNTRSDDPDNCVHCYEEPGVAYNHVEAADALGDIRYIVDGGNLICGFPGEEILQEIHRSNMSKLGEDGKPITRADGKTLKGPNYFKPNIAAILNNHSGKKF